jgi:hypothetical protein
VNGKKITVTFFYINSFALTFAAASNRTLVFDEDSMKWIGWHQIFEPITKCKYAEIVCVF